MKKFLKLKSTSQILMTSVIATFAVIGIAAATTTIGTNITTGGSLSVTGTTTFNSIAYNWPAADGSSGQVLSTDGAGVLSWASAGSGGWTDAGTTVYPTTMSDRFLIGTTSPSGLSQLTVEATSTAGIPLTLRGYTGQSANLLQVQNSASTNLFALSATGGVTMANGATLVNGSASTLTITEDTLAVVGDLSVTGSTTLNSIAYTWPAADGSAGQVLSTNGSGMLSWSAASTAGGWTDSGVIVYPTGMSDSFLIGTTTPAGLSQLTVEATSTAGTPLTLRGFAGQSANLLQVQNVSNVSLFALSATGGITMANGATLVNGDTNTLTITEGTLAMVGNLSVSGGSLIFATASSTGNSTLHSASIGYGGTTITGHFSNTASLDFDAIAANSCASSTITVTGAADGDVVSIGAPNAFAMASTTLAWSGWVSEANTVMVRICQVAAEGTIDLPAATFRADVWKH